MLFNIFWNSLAFVCYSLLFSDWAIFGTFMIIQLLLIYMWSHSTFVILIPSNVSLSRFLLLCFIRVVFSLATGLCFLIYWTYGLEEATIVAELLDPCDYYICLDENLTFAGYIVCLTLDIWRSLSKLKGITFLTCGLKPRVHEYVKFTLWCGIPWIDLVIFMERIWNWVIYMIYIFDTLTNFILAECL